jgi:hypothetical protein
MFLSGNRLSGVAVVEFEALQFGLSPQANRTDIFAEFQALFTRWCD